MSVTALAFALVCGICSAQFCPTLHADFLRRQAAAPFSSPAPYNETYGSKHVPYITVDGTNAVVIVGDESAYHPMVASSDPGIVHFVTHIYVLDQDGNFVVMEVLNPEGSSRAQMEFEIPAGVTMLQAFEWCNKHGLWMGPKVIVTDGKNAGSCSKDDVDSAAQTSFVADFKRRQAALPFSSATPFNETRGAKHVPYIILNGSTGTVTVGDGSPFHPMVASSDPDIVHFVTHIYVLDQDGKIVTMQNLDPTGMSKASIKFEVPSTAYSLTAYEFCNKHGLWHGPTVQIPKQNDVQTTIARFTGVSLSCSILSRLNGVIAALVATVTARVAF